MKSVFSHLRARRRDRLHDACRQFDDLNAGGRAFREKDLKCFWGGVHFQNKVCFARCALYVLRPKLWVLFRSILLFFIRFDSLANVL